MTARSAFADDELALARALGEIACAAGAVILDVREKGAHAREKADLSPVTEADERSEALIVEALARLVPGVTIVAEEQVARDGPPAVGEAFLLVDALDGTRGFLDGQTVFTVNIALVADRAPVWGVVYEPVAGDYYFGGPSGAFFAPAPAGGAPDFGARRGLQTRAYPPEGLTATCSVHHMDPDTWAFLEAVGPAKRYACGAAKKFCEIAEGRADFYPRFLPTSEWDTAAGHAILAAAGGQLLTPDGAPFLYAKPKFLNGPFVAWGRDRVA